MKISDAIAEARAIDGRAVAGVLPPLEDTLRVFELLEVFDQVCQAEPTEVRRSEMAQRIVAKLSDASQLETR